MSEPARLVVASANQGKISELVALFASHGIDQRYTVEPRPAGLADTIEDGDTLEANATKKATEVCTFAGATALADDTGLFVDALHGAPGVRTARYAGEEATDADNIEKLLASLDGVDDRRARFQTVIALAHPDGSVLLATGTVEGTIAEAPMGDGGFGYDPVFMPVEGDGRVFAQMTSEEKNLISHRGRALRALIDQLSV
jgi:XTP/dITP diphosphohydrolase